MARYYFFVGPPGSGKSTYAQMLQEQHPDLVMVSPDEIRQRINDRDHRRQSEQAFAIARQEVAAALLAGHDVIFDATNTIRAHRCRNIAVGKPYATVVCIWFQTSLEECLRRHEERIQRDVRVTMHPDSLRRMWRQLQENPPSLEEGFDEIISVEPAFTERQLTER